MNTNQVEIHKTLTGEALPLGTLSPDLADFINQVLQAAQDPTVDEDAITALVWGPENPLLDTTTLPGRAIATRETYEHTAFQAMLDLIGRKRLQTGGLDMTGAAARYTLTVPEAADKLGVHQTTVRVAIREGRLAAMKKGGVYYLDSDSVESYQVSTRGQRAVEHVTALPPFGLMPGVLEIKKGTEGNFFLRIKGAMETLAAGSDDFTPYSQIVPPWRPFLVMRGKKDKNDFRVFLLEPEPDPDKAMEITFAGFYVRGGFRIAKRINNSREAMEYWETFDGSAVPFKQSTSSH